jgi:DNA-binding transcriptional MerR regulator
MIVRNIFNAHHFNDDEINEQPSMTVPDQSMSVRELLSRYANGLPLGGIKEQIYEGEDGDGIDPRRLDLAERQELEIAARQELAEIEERLKSKKVDKSKVKLTDEQIQDIESQDVENI